MKSGVRRPCRRSEISRACGDHEEALQRERPLVVLQSGGMAAALQITRLQLPPAAVRLARHEGALRRERPLVVLQSGGMAAALQVTRLRLPPAAVGLAVHASGTGGATFRTVAGTAGGNSSPNRSRSGGQSARRA